MKHKFSNRQIWVLIGACLFQCALIGTLVNSSSVLINQIREEYLMPMTRISSFHTVKGIVGALAGAMLTTLFFRMDKRAYMSLMIVSVAISYMILIPGASSDIIWYSASILVGMSFCTSTVMVPYLLDRWFPENAGTATGIATAFSGLGGILFNPFSAWLIERFGWRWAIFILGIITVVMGLGALIPMFRDPVPEKQQTVSEETDEHAKVPFPVKKFLLCAISLMAGAFALQFCQYTAMFSQSAGYPLQVGASLTAVFMAGNVGGKLIFGWICDRVGIYRTMALSMFSVIIGSLICIFLKQHLIMLYVGFLLYGNVYALTMISLSRCSIATYGIRGAKRYMGLHTSINGFLQAGAALSVGFLYDATGSFNAELLLGIVLMAISSGAALTLQKLPKE